MAHRSDVRICCVVFAAEYFVRHHRLAFGHHHVNGIVDAVDTRSWPINYSDASDPVEIAMSSCRDRENIPVAFQLYEKKTNIFI